MSKCTICGEVIELRPSAEERAKKYGETAAFYRSLFTTHATCAIRKNKEEVSALIRTLPLVGGKAVSAGQELYVRGQWERDARPTGPVIGVVRVDVRRTRLPHDSPK